MREVYTNGTVYTADSNKPVATAFVVEDGKFIYVGDDAGAEKFGPGVNLSGAAVIPGLVDSHCHLLTGAVCSEMEMLFITPQKKIEDLGQELYKEYKKTFEGREPEPGEVVRAMISEPSLSDYDGRDLDRIFKYQAVYIFSDDGHALLMNSAARLDCGIENSVKNPEGGSFVRDKEGNLTGLVLEIPAIKMCAGGFKAKITDKTKDALKYLFDAYHSLGITTLFDAATITGDNDELIDKIKELEREKELGMRTGISFVYYGEELTPAADFIEKVKAFKIRYESKLITPFVIKMIPDGTVEEHTALLTSEYSDAPGNRGLCQLDFDELAQMTKLAVSEGIDVHVHAIGDETIERVLENYKEIGPAKVRKTIAHNQLYTKKSRALLDENKDVFFNTTPHWVKADDYTKGSIGEERFKNQFPVATALRKGLTITFSSDSSTDGFLCNPFEGMYYAVKRGAGDESVTYPPKTEGISMGEALECYTINGAKQLGLEDRVGSISSGKEADFVILDRDIFKADIEEVRKTRVVATYFRGSMVFRGE